MMAKQQEEADKAGQKNLEEGQAFLEKNKTVDGVVTTESGLQYSVLKEGEGKSPGESDRVMVHYKGTKLDGTEFDSFSLNERKRRRELYTQVDNTEPLAFTVDEVDDVRVPDLERLHLGGPASLATALHDGGRTRHRRARGRFLLPLPEGFLQCFAGRRSILAPRYRH